ncbi:hypothetical protein HPP92_009590 [Vanilla planifolia]|uniref:Uncharacterized protein n=1 Tax=Vanilla planifolia TaxID=51239 RepID=A0A835R4I2_VANPL|nr:hypothetical protein HPP92_009590 [Vanilla planifolia]
MSDVEVISNPNGGRPQPPDPRDIAANEWSAMVKGGHHLDQPGRTEIGAGQLRAVARGRHTTAPDGLGIGSDSFAGSLSRRRWSYKTPVTDLKGGV